MSTAISETHVSDAKLAHKGLLSEDLWERLVHRIIEDENIDRPFAERIMNEALGFLLLCAAEPETSYSPSRMVDAGWHAFILHTRAYAAFCDSIKGSFIHHEPFLPEVRGVALSARTVEALRAHKIAEDPELWLPKVGDCHSEPCGVQCDPGTN